MKRSLFILIVMSSVIHANVLSQACTGSKTLRGVSEIDNLSLISNAGRLSKVTQKILLNSSKPENLQNLMALAVKENKVEFIEQCKYIQTFKNIENGDNLLLLCLKNQNCNLVQYTNIISKPPTPLHYQLIVKNPSLNLSQLNIKVGTINENLMNKYFQSTGWTKIEGEVGRNGIDGLFLKRKNGVIVDVLVVESKYNKSGLQHTQHGQQMTKQWVNKKLDDLIRQYPENSDYITIKGYVDNDIYRAMLWNMKTTDESLLITLKHIHDKAGKAVPINVTGSSKMKINYKGNQEIFMDISQNDFHNQIVSWYKSALQKI